MVVKQTANVRVGPDRAAVSLKVVPTGTTVNVFEKRGSWIKIGETAAWGWTHASLLQQPQASAPDTFNGRIAEFTCGDNCYLTVVDDFGKQHNGLCVAPTCAPWNKATAIPKGLVGRQVSVKVGMGVQIDSSGTEQGRMLSFREITLFPAGESTQP